VSESLQALMGVDDSVSMMVAVLESLGELDHTYVIFTSVRAPPKFLCANFQYISVTALLSGIVEPACLRNRD
jgi:hypothetical protein